MATDADGRQYRLVGDNHYHDGERLRTGDVFVPTERELEAFGFKFEPVEDEDDVPAAAGGGDDEDPDGDGGATETCDAELSSGGTCGRELPCPYHSDEA